MNCNKYLKPYNPRSAFTISTYESWNEVCSTLATLNFQQLGIERTLGTVSGTNVSAQVASLAKGSLADGAQEAFLLQVDLAEVFFHVGEAFVADRASFLVHLQAQGAAGQLE